MKITKEKIILLFILVVALFFRLWRLGEIPPSMNWDETSLGYNAYSILKTGRDEYNHFLPLVFKSFGDYKVPVYVYLTIPSIAVFGLNEFAVRLPAAIFGGLSVLVLYLFANELFKNFRYRQAIALLAAGLLAISPWSYHYSHSAWEVTVQLVFLLLGATYLLRSQGRKMKELLLAMVFFSLSIYTYHSAKILVPLTIIGFVWLMNKQGKILVNKLIMSLLLLFVLVLPIISLTFFGGAGGRFKVMSIFSYPRSQEETNQIRDEENLYGRDLYYQLFHSEVVYYFRGVTGRYLNHFSPRFLFFEGAWNNERLKEAQSGVLNLVDILLLPLGVYYLLSRRVKNQSFVWYLLLFAPLPAALSRDVVQSTRSYLMVIPLTLISAFGLYFLWETLARFKFIIRYGLLGLLATVYLFMFATYLDQYFLHSPIQYSKEWQYGYKEAVNFVLANQANYDQVIFTDKYSQPYIYYLFYNRYDPAKYQAQAKLTESSDGDVGKVEHLDKITFRSIFWPADRFTKNILYVGTPFEIPNQDINQNESVLLKKVSFLNGETAFNIVGTLK